MKSAIDKKVNRVHGVVQTPFFLVLEKVRRTEIIAVRTFIQFSNGQTSSSKNERQEKMKISNWGVSMILVLVFLSALGGSKLYQEENLTEMKTFGGIHDYQGTANSAEIENIGHFAVQEHNKKENTVLKFARVVKVKEQVVAGKIYYLTLEAVGGAKTKVYDATVWVKPWLNFKQLQVFKYAHDSSSFTSSDLGSKRVVRGTGWQTVATHDPEVQGAAHHAVNIIQQRSNSLSPYQLLDILKSKAEVIEEAVNFSLHLKVKRGKIVEKFKVVVNKNVEGQFNLNLLEQDLS